MSRIRKLASRNMSDAEVRVAAMKTIDKSLDLDNGVNVAAIEAVIADANAALADYNASLAISDEKLNVFNAKEKLVKELSAKILPAVKLKYGADSSEYEKVGGTRASERKRPVRKPKSN